MDAIVPIWREELMHVRVTGGMAAVVKCLLAEAVECVSLSDGGAGHKFTRRPHAHAG
jgi:hypothetical protein